jgi:hypothetical protein
LILHRGGCLGSVYVQDNTVSSCTDSVLLAFLVDVDDVGFVR